MLKLYRFKESAKEYWETWEDSANKQHVVHWGELGTRGSSKAIKTGFFGKAVRIIQIEVDERISQGYCEIPPDEYSILMIEYAVENMGSVIDLDKRHRLEDRMNETLGWAGLGACDGGSIGSGTMEVCNFVVDFDVAKRVIEEDLADTEFADYVRIYDERAE